MRLDVLWTGRELTAVELKGRTVVVIDVLRASTTILTALEAGARTAIVCGSAEEAARVAGSLGRSETTLCGERGGARIEGCDLGNSPLEYTTDAVSGGNLVFSTTNGTPAMSTAAAADHLFLGCFRNLDAVANRVRESDGPVVIVCAGRAGRVSLDDSLCAGLIVRRLAEADAGVDISDGGIAARHLAEKCGYPDSSWLASTEGGGALVRSGYEMDLDFCAAMNVTRKIPTWSDGGFQLLSEDIDVC